MPKLRAVVLFDMHSPADHFCVIFQHDVARSHFISLEIVGGGSYLARRSVAPNFLSPMGCSYLSPAHF